MQQEKIVKLDTKIFEGKKPRDWHKIVKEYVYNNLAGKTIIIHNEDGSVEEICFARTNERVRKDNANNSHKVIDKLIRNDTNIKNLAIIHIIEILKVSKTIGENKGNSHQWLDTNGWKFRTVYIKYNKIVWEITLNIAKTKDKRNILYDINKIKKVDSADVSSIKGPSRISTFSDKNIP